MQNFLKNSLIFILFNLLAFSALIAFLSLKSEHKIYENWQTKSNLLIIPENTEYDLLIMGGSQARIFSRGINHNKMEELLDKKILNIARLVKGGGIKQEKAYLTYFYERKNKANKILFFLTPWILYSKKLNEENLESFSDEPFNLHFFIVLLKNDLSKNIILNYLKSNFNNRTSDIKNHRFPLNQSYVYKLEDKKSLIEFEFSDGFEEKIFQKHARELINTIKLAQKNNAEVIFIIPSTMIGSDIIGMKQLKILLEELKTTYNTKFYDFSNEINEQNNYFNIDHLNTKGVTYFTEKYLQKAVNG